MMNKEENADNTSVIRPGKEILDSGATFFASCER
jgi:hypothetical protein